MVKLFKKWFKICICTKVCDCQNPPPDGWDGKDGVWLVSNECPIHNDFPDPNPECTAKRHRNGALD